MWTCGTNALIIEVAVFITESQLCNANGAKCYSIVLHVTVLVLLYCCYDIVLVLAFASN